MNTTEELLQRLQIVSCSDLEQQPQKFLELLRFDSQANPFIVSINNVGELNESQILRSIERRNLFSNDWMAFDQLVFSFVKLCNQMNPWSLLESFDLYAAYLNDIAIAFMNKKRGYLVTGLLENNLRQILPMAKKLDNQMLLKEMSRKPRLGYMASILLKVFNNIRSQLGAEDRIEAAKRTILLSTGIKLCQTYFLLSSPLLCQNVFSNIKNANLSLDFYPRNEQLQYRYFLARFHMAKYEFVDAFQNLKWCLEHVPINYTIDNSNVTKILQEFLPVSILLGKQPNFLEFSRCFYSAPARLPKFFVLYTSFALAAKSGNFSRIHFLLNDQNNLSALKQHGLSFCFGSKLYLITLRNLVRSVWVAQGKQMRLEYDAVKIGLSFALNGLDLNSIMSLIPNSNLQKPEGQTWQDLHDYVIENCLVTLIDQNLLRGKLFPRLRVVSLAKNGVFPDVYETYVQKFSDN